MNEAQRIHPVGFYLICGIVVLLEAVYFGALPRYAPGETFQEATEAIRPYRLWIAILAPIFGGLLADRLRAYRGVTAVGVLLVGAGTVLVPTQSDRVWTIFVPLFMAYVGYALSFLGLYVLLGNLYPRHSARKDQAFLGVAAVTSFGAFLAVALPMRRFVLNESDGRLFVASIATGVGLLLLAFGRAYRSAERPDPTEQDVQGSSHESPKPRPAGGGCRRGVLALVVIVVVFSCVSEPVSTDTMLASGEVMGADAGSGIGIWAARLLPLLLPVVVVLLLAFSRRSFATTGLLVVGMILVVAAIAAQSLVPSGVILWAAAVTLVLLGGQLVAALARSFIHRVTPHGRRGLGLGLWIGVTAFAGYLVSLLAIAVEKQPPTLKLIASGTVCTLCVAAVYRWRRSIQAAADGESG